MSLRTRCSTTVWWHWPFWGQWNNASLCELAIELYTSVCSKNTQSLPYLTTSNPQTSSWPLF